MQRTARREAEHGVRDLAADLVDHHTLDRTDPVVTGAIDRAPLAMRGVHCGRCIRLMHLPDRRHRRERDRDAEGENE